MFTLKVEEIPSNFDFSLLKYCGDAFKSAGKVSKHRSGGGYDIWICSATDSCDLSRNAEKAVGKIIDLGGLAGLNGYFCMGMLPERANMVDIITITPDLMHSLSKLRVDLKICYYPE